MARVTRPCRLLAIHPGRRRRAKLVPQVLLLWLPLSPGRMPGARQRGASRGRVARRRGGAFRLGPGGRVRMLQPALQPHPHARPLGAAQQHDERDDRLPPPREARLAGRGPPQRPLAPLRVRSGAALHQGDERHGRLPARKRPGPRHRPRVCPVQGRFPRFPGVGQRLRPRAVAAVRIHGRPGAAAPALRRHAALRRLPRQPQHQPHRLSRAGRLV